MTTPTTPAPKPSVPAPSVPAAPTAKPAAPAGVGAAPTTTAPATPPAPKEEEPGYVETAVLAIKEWIVGFFKWLFCCFVKEEPKPAPAASPLALPASRHQERLNRLKNGTMQGHDILSYFNYYFPFDNERNHIYEKIGKAANPWLKSYHVKGQEMVQSSPELVKSELISRIESRIAAGE